MALACTPDVEPLATCLHAAEPGTTWTRRSWSLERGGSSAGPGSSWRAGRPCPAGRLRAGHGARRADRHHSRHRRRAARLLQRVPPSRRPGGARRGGNRKRSSAATTAGPTAWTARCVTAPEMDGAEDFDHAVLRPPAGARRTWGPFVFVNLDDEAPAARASSSAPSREVDAPASTLGRCARVERRDYMIECNWKVYVDNYLEGYHIPIAHPALFREIDYDGYRVETVRYYSQADRADPRAEGRPGVGATGATCAHRTARRTPSTTGSSPTRCSTSTPTT